jgi:hypothetical protein
VLPSAGGVTSDVAIASRSFDAAHCRRLVAESPDLDVEGAGSNPDGVTSCIGVLTWQRTPIATYHDDDDRSREDDAVATVDACSQR